MPRRTLAIVVTCLVALCLSAACDGGGEDGERVRIRPLDLEGVELSLADYFDPPFVDQYPSVVAEVNGEAITGQALAARQVLLELSRRQLAGGSADVYGEEFMNLQLAEIESIDPLETLIDEELLRQAVNRLDYLPSYEEAVAYTNDQEEWHQEAMGQASAEERQLLEEMLRLQGFPDEDWASDREVVEAHRQAMGLAGLKTALCKGATTMVPSTPGVNLVTSGRDCDEFLAEQRSDADIRYFVEWQDWQSAD